jgi:hypothetical protein
MMKKFSMQTWVQKSNLSALQSFFPFQTYQHNAVFSLLPLCTQTNNRQNWQERMMGPSTKATMSCKLQAVHFSFNSTNNTVICDLVHYAKFHITALQISVSFIEDGGLLGCSAM